MSKKRKIHMSLSGKVILILIASIFLCAVLWTVVMFFNMSRNANDIALYDEQTYMKNVETNTNNVEEVCNMAKQIIAQNTSLIDYLIKTRDGKDLESVEKIDFYNREIGAIDNMTNINPYLYQIRLFANSDITEKKPCLYRIDRIKNMDWAGKYIDGQWQIDYIDKVFPGSVNEKRHLAGIITEIRDDKEDLIAVLEISTEIENLFKDYYNDSDDEICCFISDEGKIYASDKNLAKCKENEELLRNHMADNKNISMKTNFEEESCIISTLEMSALNGTFVHIKKTGSIIASYYVSQIPYIVVVFVSMVFFVIIVLFMVKNIFKRFNILTDQVNLIAKGEKMKLTEVGNDEISELGIQINNMVSALEKLNEENTSRQLLVKNAEIKSLQNQINAHFMYNVLETIKMMAEIKEDYEISDAITSLGEMFRYSMQWSSGMVVLREEISYIRKYLNLLNLRFEYEIFLALSIPEEFMDLRIPKMSLQPIVENSVYHGIEDMAEDTYIYIKAFKEDDIINIEVSDAGIGMTDEKLNEIRERLSSAQAVNDESEHGRALYNVQQRIKMYFGPEYGLEIFSKEGVFTKVLIKIPAEKESNNENTVISGR